MGKFNASVSGSVALGLACMMLFPRNSAALTLGEVLYACDSKLKENRALCAGYFMGAMDARLFFGAMRTPPVDCSNERLSYGEMQRKVVAALRRHPNKSDPAGTVIAFVAEEFAPCTRVKE